MLYILTLSYNGADKLSKLHQSLLPALEGLNYEWLVKDNGSKDDTVAMVSSWGGNIKVIPYKDNRQNFSEGCNYLFQEASPKDSDYVMLLNNDVVFNDKSSIKDMLSIIQKDDAVGVVGAKLLYSNTDLLQHAGVIFDSTYRTPWHYRAKQKSDKDAEQNRMFQAVTGAVCITKAEYFRNICDKNKSGIKGMDEQFIWSFDDIDMCLSIKYNMNKKIVYCGSTNIFHEESATLKKNPANKLFLNHNLKYLFDKWDKRYMMDKELYVRNPKYNLYVGKQ